MRAWGLGAIAAAGLLSATGTAQAQWNWGSYGEPPEPPPMSLSSRDIGRIAAAHGLRLLTAPFLNGRFYVVDALDRVGSQQRLIIDSEDGEILQRFRVRSGSSEAYAPPTAPLPRRQRGLFGLFTEDDPPVPAEDIPGPRPRSRPLPYRNAPAVASVNPDPTESTDLPPPPNLERQKPKPRRQFHAKRPDQSAEHPALDHPAPEIGEQANASPKLNIPPKPVSPPAAVQPAAVAPPPATPPKSVAASQSPALKSPAPAPPPPAHVVPAVAPQPPKPKGPLNDIPPAPLD